MGFDGRGRVAVKRRGRRKGLLLDRIVNVLGCDVEQSISRCMAKANVIVLEGLDQPRDVIGSSGWNDIKCNRLRHEAAVLPYGVRLYMQQHGHRVRTEMAQRNDHLNVDVGRRGESEACKAGHSWGGICAEHRNGVQRCISTVVLRCFGEEARKPTASKGCSEKEYGSPSRAFAVGPCDQMRQAIGPDCTDGLCCFVAMLGFGDVFIYPIREGPFLVLGFARPPGQEENGGREKSENRDGQNLSSAVHTQLV